MMLTRKALILAGLISCLSTAAPGQITAKGGREQFTSPMVLNIPLKTFLAYPIGKRWTTYETKEFTCDGVTISALSLMEEMRKGNKPAKLEVQIYTSHEGGHDKVVSVKFEVVKGEKTLSTGNIRAYELESGDAKSKKTTLAFPLERDGSEPEPGLRVTFSVRGN